MIKSTKITGLDCPNCAKTLEIEINKLECVTNAKIDFLKATLTFESNDVDLALNKIIALTKQIEPNAKIKTNLVNNNKFGKMFFVDLALLIVGIALGITIFFVKVPVWAYWTLYTISALMLGYKTYYKALTQLFRGVINENLLITISVIGASIVSEHMEGLMVIALYSIGKIFEGLAVDKSRKSIESLVKTQPEYAVILTSEGEQKVEPSEVKIGSTIIVKAGEKVALDGIILEGTCDIDTQSLTGESVPVSVKAGSKVLSGSIVLNGVLKIKTTSIYKDSAINKIMDLVENAQKNKSKTETFIAKITKWYTLGVVVLAVMVWGIVWAVTKNFSDAIYRGLIFLVISCPCAFAISVPLSYFGGLGNASKHGVLIKGSNYLDALTNLDVMAFDKTGTLTTGEFKIDKVNVFDSSKTEQDILYLAALGEQGSLHPLAKAICASQTNKLESVSNIKEVAGKGVEYIYKNKNYFVGRRSENLDNTAVELFENNVKLGEIILSDTIKNTSLQTIGELKKLGIKTILLSGDNRKVANSVANELNIDQVESELLPEEKYKVLKNLKTNKMHVGYVGDGLNDAPSLTVADVGISMGINGSPASVEASDVVLVDDNPKKIVDGIKISKFTKRIVISNIVLSAVIKLVFLTLGAVGITGMLAAVFADVGVTLIAILNSLQTLKFNPNKNKHS